ncbi:helix-turn-helix transcriptional regulator [Kurthia populi]|uniref:Helix-turn-helix transcriptional regulator n=1 Tax=Kurthia populi TaxID=1562132 RepID=A0ABW5Y3C0_9BACL|nr:helix-turn-helix transcriptional regulator [Kurthia sp. Dielmo]
MNSFKKSLQQHTNLQFTEKMKQTIREEVAREAIEADRLLQLLQQPQSGFALCERLKAKQQSAVYVTLHRLEVEGLICSTWQEEEKIYKVSATGLKRVKRYEKAQRKMPLQQLLEEARHVY